MSQRDLFVLQLPPNVTTSTTASVPSPMHRRFDPDTSVAAAENVKPHLSELQEKVMRAFRVHGPMTAKQCERLDEFYTLSPSTVRKRVSELERKGLLTFTGQRIDGCREYEA